MEDRYTMLVMFSGLPGTGKTTIASRLARELAAVYLRVDGVESGIVRSGLAGNQWDLGRAGYYAAHAVALDNLRNRMTVVADAVNPLAVNRQAWRDLAKQAGTRFMEVEVVCSDIEEHERRVESRRKFFNGHRHPTWQQVLDRRYESWNKGRLILDTAFLTADFANVVLQGQIIAMGSGDKKRRNPEDD